MANHGDTRGTISSCFGGVAVFLPAEHRLGRGDGVLDVNNLASVGFLFSATEVLYRIYSIHRSEGVAAI